MKNIAKAIEFAKKNVEMCLRFEGLEINKKLKREFATEIHKTILAALKEKQQREQGCIYSAEEQPDGDIVYTCSICNEAHVFISGGPTENNHKYCCSCGIPIKEIKEFKL